ncbi:MAG: hypothetical protein H7A25_23275 [Leptospiraceae bacterium]|nr:hypothetical protein [Leptospiraceae bacterium]MCP5502841.1 hypothetical protein [Leptospiraceae bacterium]
MPLSSEQLIEIQKYQRLINLLETIQQKSKRDNQKERARLYIEKYKKRILEISPDGIPQNIHYSTYATAEKEKHKKAGEENSNGEGKAEIEKRNPLENLVVMKLTPHCNDSEINLIATLLNRMEMEYLPVLGDSHISLDFTHATERDNLIKSIENIRRNMKVLTETIEEYALCDKQDFKEQLGRMKNKQSRLFMSEAVEVFQEFKTFIHKILDDNESTGGTVIQNIDEEVHFNPRFDRATILEGRTVGYCLEEFYEFTKSAIQNINLPNFRR